jgi:hypothetical protein
MILFQDRGTASQTARGIARSATGFEIAPNVTCKVNAKVEIAIVCLLWDEGRRLSAQLHEERSCQCKEGNKKHPC